VRDGSNVLPLTQHPPEEKKKTEPEPTAQLLRKPSWTSVLDRVRSTIGGKGARICEAEKETPKKTINTFKSNDVGKDEEDQWFVAYGR